MKNKKYKIGFKGLLFFIFILRTTLIYSVNEPKGKGLEHFCNSGCNTDFFTPKKSKNNKGKAIKTVVIDAGHGGKDPGCMGAIHREKDVTLGIALRLGKLIEENLKDVKVIYTRKTDVFVELEERAQIANRHDADLFISIHCNAAATTITYKDKKGKTRKKEVLNPKPFGSETYVMGIKNERGNMEVAKRENAAMLLEENYKKTYNGFDPNSDEAYIIMSIFTGAFVEQSAIFASKIQNEYTRKAGRIDKGVHRQSIWVLWRTAMPSVLTEVGFLTNPEEEKFLGSEKGQKYLSTALFRALRDYKNEVEGNKMSYNDEFENETPLDNENKGVVYEEKVAVNDSAIASDQEKLNLKTKALIKEGDKMGKEGKFEEALKFYRQADELKTGNEDLKNKISLTEIKLTEAKESEKSKLKAEGENTLKYNNLIKEADALLEIGNLVESKKKYIEALNCKPGEKYPKVKLAEIEEKGSDEKPVNANDLIEKYKGKDKSEKTELTKTPSEKIEYKIQFASSEKEINLKDEKYKNLETINYYKSGNLLKYTAGIFLNLKDAQSYQKKVRELGFKDAFIVSFLNGQRIESVKSKGEK